VVSGIRGGQRACGAVWRKHGFAALVEDLDVRVDDGAVAFGGGLDAGDLHHRVDGVIDAHRTQHLLRAFEHCHARALDHRLQDEAFDERVGEGGRHRTSPDGARRAFGIDEDDLQHAGARNEVDQVGLGHRAVEGLEYLTDLEVLPEEAVAQQWVLRDLCYHMGAP
jgi:hypothetical protein